MTASGARRTLKPKGKPAEPASELGGLSVRELESRLASERAAIDAAKEAGRRGLKQVARAEMPAVHQKAVEQVRAHADTAVALKAELEVRASRPIALPESWRGRARRAASGRGDAGVLAKVQAELRAKDAEERALAPPPDVPVRDGWDAVLPVLPDNLAELGRRDLGHLQVAHEQALNLLRKETSGDLTPEQRHVEQRIAEAELAILTGHIDGRWRRRDELLREKLSRELDALVRAAAPPPKPRKADPRSVSVSAAVVAWLIDKDRGWCEFVAGQRDQRGKTTAMPCLTLEDIGVLHVILGAISRGEADEAGLINLKAELRRTYLMRVPSESLDRLVRTKLLARRGELIGLGEGAISIAKIAGVRFPEPKPAEAVAV